MSDTITVTKIGHNIGFNTGPLEVDLMTEDGAITRLGLQDLLGNIDRLRGSFSFGSIKENLLSCLFLAYEDNFMTNGERKTFEAYVREHIATLGSIEAARRLVLG